MEEDAFFIAVPEDNGEDWWICWTGEKGNESWNVTTNHIHGSDLPDFAGDPEECAKLIARLLDWYCLNEKNKETIDDMYMWEEFDRDFIENYERLNGDKENNAES